MAEPSKATMGSNLSSPTTAAAAAVDEGSTTAAEAIVGVDTDGATTTSHRHSTRDRAQTNFLSPTFTPQKRSGRDNQAESSPHHQHAYAQRWDDHYNHLVQYKQAHGSCKVPPAYKTEDGVALGKWVENQRGFYNRKKMSLEPGYKLERYQRLVSLGFDFGKKSTIGDDHDDTAASPDVSAPAGSTQYEPKTTTEPATLSPNPAKRWEQLRQQLINYKNENGNCNVPSTYKENPPLAKWVENQRMSYHKQKLSDERIALLEEIGFEFGASKSDRWDFHLNELVQYKSRVGDCDVPRNYRANPSLGRWAAKQRERRRGEKLPQEQYEQLKKVGFNFHYGSEKKK